MPDGSGEVTQSRVYREDQIGSAHLLCGILEVRDPRWRGPNAESIRPGLVQFQSTGIAPLKAHPVDPWDAQERIKDSQRQRSPTVIRMDRITPPDETDGQRSIVRGILRVESPGESKVWSPVEILTPDPQPTGQTHHGDPTASAHGLIGLAQYSFHRHGIPNKAVEWPRQTQPDPVATSNQFGNEPDKLQRVPVALLGLNEDGLPDGAVAVPNRQRL